MTMATLGNTTANGGRTTGIYFIDKASMSGAGDIVVTFLIIHSAATDSKSERSPFRGQQPDSMREIQTLAREAME